MGMVVFGSSVSANQNTFANLNAKKIFRNTLVGSGN